MYVDQPFKQYSGRILSTSAHRNDFSLSHPQMSAYLAGKCCDRHNSNITVEIFVKKLRLNSGVLRCVHCTTVDIQGL